jgi:hypothetical protein
VSAGQEKGATLVMSSRERLQTSMVPSSSSEVVQFEIIADSSSDMRAVALYPCDFLEGFLPLDRRDFFLD